MRKEKVLDQTRAHSTCFKKLSFGSFFVVSIHFTEIQESLLAFGASLPFRLLLVLEVPLESAYARDSSDATGLIVGVHDDEMEHSLCACLSQLLTCFSSYKMCVWTNC